MDSTTPTHDADTQPVVFRGKKRKLYRQRGADDGGSNSDIVSRATDGLYAENASQIDPASLESPPTKDEEELSVAEILRRRNARKSRLRGVGFGSGEDAASGALNSMEDELSLMIREEQGKAIDLSAQGMTTRFAAQTGMVTELVNKHMTEYIESEMAKRKSAASPAGLAVADASSTGKPPSAQLVEIEPPRKPEMQTAMHGKLMEVDLGDEARNRNEAKTDRARRMLQGETIEEEEQSARPKKVRLGRDGKPWRSRNRRDSDAIKRDQLVEEILRENRLDVYEAPTPPNVSTPLDDDGAADDRIAEEFRREFLDAMAQRQQKKKPAAPPPKPGAKKEEEVLKGPKLGGSRNARAAMRDLLLKQQEGKR